MEKAEFYREARTDVAGPLAGIRVLEATTTWAGPMCACVLADLGADVIKVELPGGEVNRHLPPFIKEDPPISPWHATVNRNKRCMTLDLRKEDEKKILLDLAARSDIVVENFRPGRMDHWGVGYEGVKAVKPDIIYVSISGWGQFGPEHDRIGYDPLAQAVSGFMSLNGSVEGGPTKAATALADDLGGLHATIGALAALAHRQRTGEGQHIDVSLLDVMLFQSNGALTLGALGRNLPRMGNEYVICAPANAYPCRDGEVYVGVILDSHWKVLAKTIGRPELGDDPDFATTFARIERRDDVNRILGEWVAVRTVEEVVEQFTREGVAAAPVKTYVEAAQDPHVQARDMLQTTLLEDGTEAPITGPPVKFSRTPTRVRTGPPAAGAHTDEILRELGISKA
jgi:formyl-CoA transferase